MKYFSLILVFSIVFLISLESIADSLKSDQELKELPNMKSKVVGKVSKGEIEVIDKKGFWIKVKKDSVEGWTKLNNTIGLSRILVSNDIPESVPNNFINNLQLRCDLSGRLLRDDELKIGSKVEIIRGPFAEMIGSIESVEPKERVSLLFEIMGRKTRTIISNKDIESVI